MANSEWPEKNPSFAWCRPLPHLSKWLPRAPGCPSQSLGRPDPSLPRSPRSACPESDYSRGSPSPRPKATCPSSFSWSPVTSPALASSLPPWAPPPVRPSHSSQGEPSANKAAPSFMSSRAFRFHPSPRPPPHLLLLLFLFLIYLFFCPLNSPGLRCLSAFMFCILSAPSILAPEFIPCLLLSLVGTQSDLV